MPKSDAIREMRWGSAMCKHLWASHITPCPMCANEADESSNRPLGDTRNPVFGEWMRGIWASKSNPIRDGMYVETIRRAGKVNCGIWYRLTDGKGKFWELEAKSTAFLCGEFFDAEEVRAMREKVAQLERGEYICKKCGLRKDDEHPKGDF